MAKVTGQVMKSNGTQQVTPVVYYSRPVTCLGHIESAASQRQVDTDLSVDLSVDSVCCTCSQAQLGEHCPGKLSLAGAATSTIFVATKYVFCRQKVCLSRQNYVCLDKSFVATNTFAIA